MGIQSQRGIRNKVSRKACFSCPPRRWGHRNTAIRERTFSAQNPCKIKVKESFGRAENKHAPHAVFLCPPRRWGHRKQTYRTCMFSMPFCAFCSCGFLRRIYFTPGIHSTTLRPLLGWRRGQPVNFSMTKAFLDIIRSIGNN